MLTFEEVKAMEYALGAEKAKPFIEAFQNADARVMASLLAEVATKVDIARLEGIIARLEGTTKADLERLQGATRADFEKFQGATRADFEKFQGATRAELEKFQGATRADFEKFQGATKADFEKFQGATKAEIEKLRGDTRADLEKFRGEMNARLARLETMTTVLIGLAVVAIGMFSPVAAKLFSFIK